MSPVADKALWIQRMRVWCVFSGDGKMGNDNSYPTRPSNSTQDLNSPSGAFVSWCAYFLNLVVNNVGSQSISNIQDQEKLHFCSHCRTGCYVVNQVLRMGRIDSGDSMLSKCRVDSILCLTILCSLWFLMYVTVQTRVWTWAHANKSKYSAIRASTSKQ